MEILRQTMNANRNSIVHFMRNSHNKYIYMVRMKILKYFDTINLSIKNELTIKTLPYILLIWYHIAHITIAITMHPCQIRDFVCIQMYPNHFLCIYAFCIFPN